MNEIAQDQATTSLKDRPTGELVKQFTERTTMLWNGLRQTGRQVRRPDLTLATEDHNTPTLNIDRPIADPVSRTQVDTLRNNAHEFGIRIHSLGDLDQGIVHIIGPQLGLTQPGLTVVIQPPRGPDDQRAGAASAPLPCSADSENQR